MVLHRVGAAKLTNVNLLLLHSNSIVIILYHTDKK